MTATDEIGCILDQVRLKAVDPSIFIAFDPSSLNLGRLSLVRLCDHAHSLVTRATWSSW
jgi:hypothetical protein